MKEFRELLRFLNACERGYRWASRQESARKAWAKANPEDLEWLIYCAADFNANIYNAKYSAFAETQVYEREITRKINLGQRLDGPRWKLIANRRAENLRKHISFDTLIRALRGRRDSKKFKFY